MIIPIECPVCGATNKISDIEQECRRCQNDLSLLYRIKYHSYYNRVQTAMFILQKNNKVADMFLSKAKKLVKEV